MNAKRRAMRIALWGLICLALPACQGGGLFQNQQKSVAARRLTLERMRLTSNRAEAARRLELDLLSGDGSFHHPEDGVQPQSYTDQTIARLRETLRNPAWQLKKAAEPQRQQEKVWRYKLRVETEDGASLGPVVWHRPAARDLPPVMKRFENLFARARRRMHPLSERINLVPPEDRDAQQ